MKIRTRDIADIYVIKHGGQRKQTNHFIRERNVCYYNDGL